jgi:tetratricopeptide (TPR) repeat protein
VCLPLLPAAVRAQLREDSRLGADAYVRRGFEYLARPRPEDQDEAARLFRKALKKGPDRADAHIGLARVSLYLYAVGQDDSPERLSTALEQARQAVDLAPVDSSAASVMAMSLAADNRLTDALAESRRAVASDPSSADALATLCGVLRLRRDNEEALQACHRAAEIAPEDPRVLSALGDALREAGHYPQALEMFGQAIDLDHEAIVPQLGAAATLLKGGDAPGARNLYNLLLQKWDYGKSRALLGAAALLVNMQDYDQAMQVYESLDVPDGASMPAILILYGKGYCLRRLGRDAEAEYFLTTLVERLPVDYDGPARGREILFHAYEDLVAYFGSKGRERKAIALLRSACERPLVPTRLARDLAARLEAQKATAEGASVLEKAILGADPLEDPLELVDSVLRMVRLRTANGAHRLQADAPAGRALTLAAERLETSQIGAVYYRLARAQALARRPDAALRSLDQARLGGYLPIAQMSGEPDFGNVRQDPGFIALLHEGGP